MSIAVCLIALVLGYNAYADAVKEKEGLKLLGQIIGISVMVMALMGIVCGVAHKSMSYGKMSCGPSQTICSMMSKNSSCPISQGASLPDSK